MFNALFTQLNSCLLCHNLTEQSLCSGCLHDLAAIYPSSQQQIRTPEAAWAHEWASANYVPPLPSALHAWKHGGKTQFSHLFQQIMLNNPPIWLREFAPDCVLAMPLSATRRSERGFNQCDELVDALQQRYGWHTLPHHAVHRQHKAAQSTLNRAERLKNIQNSFTIHADVRDCNLLIVDDICTTGATLAELTRSLKAAGAAQIAMWVVARKM